MVYRIVYEYKEFDSYDIFELVKYVDYFFHHSDEVECILNTKTHIVEFTTESEDKAYDIIYWFMRYKRLPIETNFDILKFFNNKN